MPYDPDRHHRQSIRYPGFDYADANAYFVTVCAQDRACLFGEVVGGEVELSVAGLMVESWWHEIPRAFATTAIDAYVVMSNHFHGIVLVGAVPEGDRSVMDVGGHTGPPLQNLPPVVGADLCVRPPTNRHVAGSRDASLSAIVQWFKTMTTNDYMRGVRRYDFPPFRNRLWQRNYYDRIIRDDRELDRIREYIDGNPAGWERDEENPAWVRE